MDKKILARPLYDYSLLELANDPHYKVSGVYFITNSTNGKVYIGSSVDVYKRINWHRIELESERHSNYRLLSEYKEYGAASFYVEVAQVTDPSDRLAVEQSYIDKFRSYDEDYGYNIAKSTQSTRKDVVMSDETKKKISNALKGNTNGIGNRGKKRTKETREFLSIIRKGREPYNKGKKMDGTKMKWFTNGIVNTRAGSAPEGYYPGRSHDGKWNNQFNKSSAMEVGCTNATN